MPKKMTKITTSELILSAIFYLQQKNGVTAKEITKYICEKRGCAQKHMKENVKKALERATVKGIFCRSRGLYRINNSFGLNKILTKTKGRGKKAGKVSKPKESIPVDKADFNICFDGAKISEPMLLSELIDERMNDDDNDDPDVYIEVPVPCDQDDDDDEDFKETDDEDDDDENDFFSDDMDENTKKTEPKTLFFNENVNDNNNQETGDLTGSSECNSFSDPFRKSSREEYLENVLSKEVLEDRQDEEKKSPEEETQDSDCEIVEVESKEIKENSKEPSSESVQCNDGNQSEDEDRNNEGYDDQQEKMDWDCQVNDLEYMDRLLDRNIYQMNLAQLNHDMAWENTNGMMTQKINSIDENPTDSFEASHMSDSTR